MKRALARMAIALFLASIVALLLAIWTDRTFEWGMTAIIILAVAMFLSGIVHTIASGDREARTRDNR